MITPNHSSPETSEARRLILEDRFEEALQILERIREEDPYNGEIVAHIASIKYYQDRFDESIELHKHGVELAPENEYVSITFFVSLWGLAHMEDSLEEVKRFLSLRKSQAYIDDVTQHLAEAPKPPFDQKVLKAMEPYMQK